MKSIFRAAVAQWTTRLTRTGQTRVRIREAHIFDITLTIHWRRYYKRYYIIHSITLESHTRKYTKRIKYIDLHTQFDL